MEKFVIKISSDGYVISRHTHLVVKPFLNLKNGSFFYPFFKKKYKMSKPLLTGCKSRQIKNNKAMSYSNMSNMCSMSPVTSLFSKDAIGW